MSHEVIVKTDAGLVSGTGAPVCCFKGIPFASPPVGEFRWRPPEPARPWEGVRKADTFAPDPMQGDTKGRKRSRAERMDEDCLYLNVWVPAGAERRKLPVMVWFYGGGFSGGSASEPPFDGEVMASRGVIVVAANYRLGVLGFMAHPALSAESPHGASGNYGFLDKIAALKWVRSNIAQFGGDPDQVTAFGQSAGGASAALFLISPLAKGLFNQVILESGGTGRPLGTLSDAEQLGAGLGGLASLRAMPAADVVKLNAKYAVDARSLTSPRMLRPIIDGWSIVEDERDALMAGRFESVPLIVGTSTHEGNIGGNSPIKTSADYETFMRSEFGADADEALRLYPVQGDGDVRRELGQALSDTQFQYGAWMLAKLAQQKNAATYRYIFAYRTDPEVAAKHGDEIPFVFGNLATIPGREGAPNATDAKVSATMQNAWLNFAKTGNPNGGEAPIWPAADVLDTHLHIDAENSIGTQWRRPQMEFLDRFFSKS